MTDGDFMKTKVLLNFSLPVYPLASHCLTFVVDSRLTNTMPDALFSLASMALSDSATGSRFVKALKEGADYKNILESSDHGRAYDRFRKWKENRSVLMHGGVYKATQELDREPCISPYVASFMDLYGTKTMPSTVYVLYGESGTGKSMGAIALLREYYLLNKYTNTTLKGIMVSPKKQTGSYLDHVGEILKASHVEGWLNLLLFALNEEATSRPSLLVLDDFYFDEEGKNKDFISYMYNTLKEPGSPRLNSFVVVITKHRDVADFLCNMNGGQRIQPMKGFYETKENDWFFHCLCKMKLQKENRPLTNPTWKPVHWTIDLLMKAVRYEFSESDLANVATFDLIKDGMTPLEAVNLIATELTLDVNEADLCRPVSRRRTGKG